MSVGAWTALTKEQQGALVDALVESRKLILDMAFISETSNLLRRYGCPSGAVVIDGVEVLAKIDDALRLARRVP